MRTPNVSRRRPSVLIAAIVGWGLVSPSVTSAETLAAPRVETFARGNYVWPYAVGPYYGGVNRDRVRAAGVLHTNVGSFDLNAGAVRIPDELRSANGPVRSGARYFVVQLDPTAVKAGAFDDLASRVDVNGGAIVQNLPVLSAVARLTPEAYRAVARMGGVIHVEPFHAAFKLDPALGRTPLLDPRKAVSDIYDLEIGIWPGEDAQAVAQAIARIGGTVTGTSPDTVYASLNRARLAGLARIEAVRSINESLPMLPLGEETTTTMQTGGYNGGATPYHDAGIDGGGGTLGSPQIAMVLDSGIQLDAGDLSNTHASACVSSDFGTDPTACLTGHRKVDSYATTVSFGGTGDLEGCDSPINGGFTHGHVVAATMLGNATNVPGSYGAGWDAVDPSGGHWSLDGVAPRARLIAYDGQVTPVAVACEDPLQNTISPGDLYSGGSTGSLGESYADGARIVVFSWGAENNAYTADASDIDSFLFDKPDAMVFVAAGNAGLDPDNDGLPDAGSIENPATTKNGLAIGASGATDLTGSTAEARGRFSSTGPALVGTAAPRVAPQLMAPGDELYSGTFGLASEYACRTGDSDQLDPVECDVVSGIEGTSISAAAAAGAALLVRDYFAQGMYPSGESRAADAVPDVSGALVKSVLIASADFLSGQNTGQVGNALIQGDYRFNDIQGYGRIQLDHALPLSTWSASPSGLIVHDAGIAGGASDLGLPAAIDAAAGQLASASFRVCDDTQELRVALSWIEAAGGAVDNDLDLELIAPSGTVYLGNYFTDDDDRDNATDPVTEDCPSVPGNPNPAAGPRDASPWSLPACTRADASDSPRDALNPTEAIMLSPDYYGDGTAVGTDPDPADDDQIELGTWTIRVGCGDDASCGTSSAVQYAVAIAGGVCLGSSVRFDSDSYVCNDAADITISDLNDGADSGVALANSAVANEAEVGSRTTVDVLATSVCDDCTACIDNADCTGIGGETCNAWLVCDTETGLAFEQSDPAGLLFKLASPIGLTDGTVYDPGNGVLDVRSGDRLRVTYADETGGVADPALERSSTAQVDCTVHLEAGAITFAQFGMDAAYLVNGGCERNARGLQEFGYPDRYLDEGERAILDYAFGTREAEELRNVEVSLSCVVPDADSPQDCRPESTGCADPRRANNPPCDPSWMTILDSPQIIGLIPASSATSANFAIAMGDSIPDVTEVELILHVSAPTAGKSAAGLVVTRVVLDADEVSEYYSTDFPGGGIEYRDRQNNELIQGQLGEDSCDVDHCAVSDVPCTVDADCNFGPPTTNLYDFDEDYRFEAVIWSPLDVGGKNANLGSPWNFDLNRGNFESGLGAITDQGTIGDVIAQWGEDTNFNGLLDGFCVADPNIACHTKYDCPGATICQWTEDRDKVNGALDRGWGTGGGCGWQTRAPNQCNVTPNRPCYVDADCPTGESCSAAGPATGGIWHTGLIGNTTTASCLVSGTTPGQCQTYETVSGDTGQRTWFELLATPVVEKVNGPDHTAEITWWAWNQAVDLPDGNVVWTWELDTDVDALEPVDLVSDLKILSFGNGPFGPIADGGSAGNPGLTGGYPMFAPLSLSTMASTNGTLGNNRVGQNSCYFEFGAIPYGLWSDLGFAGPPDDDLNNGSCENDVDRACTWVCAGGTNVGDGCNGDADCPSSTCVDADPRCAGASCIRSNSTIDEYVLPSGPIRNMDITAFNGPDMRFTNLADIYGRAGERFQAAVGMLNFEKPYPSADDPVPGYGVGIDDMVIEWREFTLGPDLSDCSTGGVCASVDLATTNVYEGNSLLTITVLDDSTAIPNDCNDDGDTTDTGIDDEDCDDDGIDDVRVQVSSAAEPAGEFVTLNEAAGATEGSTGSVYRGQLPISVSSDIPGVLFVRAAGGSGSKVRVTYLDNDDGTGEVCQNDADPAARGQVQAETSVILASGNVTVRDVSLDDNKDHDGFADTRETVEMRISIGNESGVDLTGVTARLASNDPNIACVLSSFTAFPDIPAGGVETSEPGAPFVFQVADVDRATLGLTEYDILSATFDVFVQTDQFDNAASLLSVTIDLDLDVSGGSDPTTFFEGFEGGGFGAFTTMNLDATTASLATADGTRCQYSDPDWPNSNSYGQSGAATTCYPGNPSSTTDYWWRTVGPEDPPTIARSYSGDRALWLGIELPDGQLTTPLGTLEAIRTIDPVNIGWDDVCSTTRAIPCSVDEDCPAGETCDGARPELSIKHQVSFVDGRAVGLPPYETADRGIVMARLADPVTGADVGDWVRLEPYLNVYDEAGTDNYSNCLFDPTDDGSTEDDFFDPTDPDRRLGPSSTCYPVLSYVWLGDTDAAYSASALGHAEGPGLEGETGLGTWVESRFNLQQYRGRRLRLRFLDTHVKAGNSISHEATFGWNPTPVDDGWFIDDVTVVDALTTPATLSVDGDGDDPVLPDTCGQGCGTATAVLTADPDAGLSAPGQVVELSGILSTLDACPDGTAQYRYLIAGRLARDWTDNPDFVDAPLSSTTYTLQFRCSSDPGGCSDSATVLVPVACPGRISIVGSWDQATQTGAFDFGGTIDYIRAQGELATLRTGSYAATTASGLSGSSQPIAGAPPAGAGEWSLFRKPGSGGCNALWSSDGECASAFGVACPAGGRDGSLP